MVEIKSYPAKNGDAFLVKATTSPFVMLIDGGYADTFKRYIKPDLEAFAARGLALDLVVATHVDADHISGLLSFFAENGSSESPEIIPVREVLHNSLRCLVAPTTRPYEERSDDLALLRALRLRGFPIKDGSDNSGEEISARQGGSLTQLLCDGGYQWNTSSGDIPVGGDGLVDLHPSNAKITILGPSKARLDALKAWWTSEIRRMGMIGPLRDLDDAFEFLCANEAVEPGTQMLASSDDNLDTAYIPDKSITNGSSISMIVEIEGCRLLFLGDSWADETVAALTLNGPMVFDAVKVAHHGSVRNTNSELLTLIDSPHFFISTNGSGHNHPDFAVLKAIVDRPAPFYRTLHFNYSTPASLRLKEYKSEVGGDFVVVEEQADWVEIKKLETK